VAEPKESEEPVPDTELLRRHIAGDTRAFAALINRYRKELFSFLVRFTGDVELAEDVFQEAFLQLHLSAATFDQDRRLKPWLFTIAANKARDAMRSKWRKQAAPLDASVAGAEDEQTTYASLMPSSIPSPDDYLLNMEVRQAVQNIVNKMPDNLRVVLLLSYFHDFSYKDIAEMLNVPLGTVKSRLHAALNYFARQWKDAGERQGHDRQES
jgi:RNA polymerase sigma-70 factor (ECF subfamily)